MPETPAAPVAPAVHPIPDRHGQNLYSVDTELHSLLALYLPRTCCATCGRTSSASAASRAAGSTSWPAPPTATRPP